MAIIRTCVNRTVGDDDNERRIQAEVLLNAYNRELERRRHAAGAQGLLIFGDGAYFIPFGQMPFLTASCIDDGRELLLAA